VRLLPQQRLSQMTPGGDSRRSVPPIEHFAGDEDARPLTQHESFVDFIERDAARRRDRPRDAGDAGEADGDCLDEGGEFRSGQPGERTALADRRLTQEVDVARRQPGVLAQRRRERFLGPRLRQAGGEIGLCQMVDGEDGAAFAGDRLAKRA
jgi:hypothetical protein